MDERMVKKKNTVLCGSLMIKENNYLFNRFVWVDPNERVLTYDKRHLFRLMNENKIFYPGKGRLLIEYKGWRICPLICYDLRFTVYSPNNLNYDLLLFVANWPNERIQAWNDLLKARTIENVSYVVGVNRVREDSNLSFYPRCSQFLRPDGSLITIAQENEIGLLDATLSKKID